MQLVENGKLDTQSHHSWKKDRAENDKVGNSWHPFGANPKVLHHKKVPQQSYGHGKAKIVETNEDIQKMYHN